MGSSLALVFPPWKLQFWGCGWSIPEPSLVQWLSAGAWLQMWNWVIKTLWGEDQRGKTARFPHHLQVPLSSSYTLPLLNFSERRDPWQEKQGNIMKKMEKVRGKGRFWAVEKKTDQTPKRWRVTESQWRVKDTYLCNVILSWWKVWVWVRGEERWRDW